MPDTTDEPSSAGPARMSFDEAVAHVLASQAAAFAVIPVFEDDQEAAAGARIFVLDHDGHGGYLLRFVAGPFFSAAYAANEKFSSAEIPDKVRELKFLPTRCEQDWFTDPVQVLIQKLVQASGMAAPHMPDYRATPARAAAPQTEFPVSFIGRGTPTKH